MSGGTTPRTLSVTGGDKTLSGSGTTIDLGGNLTLAHSLTTAGANPLTFTTNGTTSVTLPTTGTLATLSGTETLSNKTLLNSTLQGDKIDVRFADISDADITQAKITTLTASTIISASSTVTEMVARTLEMKNPGGAETAILINTGWNRGLRILDATSYSIQLVSIDQDPASGITFATDTNLYRSAPDTLRTDDGLLVAASLRIFGVGVQTTSPTLTVTGSIRLNLANRQSGITFGGETTLFRERANVLKTGSSFITAGSLGVSGIGVAPTLATLTVGGSPDLQLTQGQSGITFGGDTTLFRQRANVLKTGSSFVTVGSLGVLGIGVEQTLPTLIVGGSLSLELINGQSGITFGGETTLFRERANVLKTGSSFVVVGSLGILGVGVEPTLPTLIVVGSLDLRLTQGRSGITFGETTLFRERANVLKTGSSFVTAGSLGVTGIGVGPTLPTLTVGGSLNLELTQGQSGITFGGETTLFRERANVLKTGSSFITVGSLGVLGIGVEQTLPTLLVGGSLSLELVNGQSGITFGGETTLFRERANVLKTGSSFVIVGSLGVLGVGVEPTLPTLTVVGSLDLQLTQGRTGITFGETTLFRERPNVLKTGSSFVTAGSLGVTGIGVGPTLPTLTVGGSLNLELTLGQSGITFGGETTLFRERANVLKTGSSFVTVGSLGVLGIGVEQTLPTLVVGGSLSLELINGQSGITFGGETTLFRERANVLKTGSSFVIVGSLGVLGVGVAPTLPTLIIVGSLDLQLTQGRSGITFGETTLFRERANILKTGSSFVTAGSLGVTGIGVGPTLPTLTVGGSLNLVLTQGQSGITFGGETTLFRERANVLKTGSSFVTVGSLGVLGIGVEQTLPTLIVGGSLSLELINGQSGITFGAETTLFRERANVLKTGSSFVTVGSLGVLGVGVEPTLPTLTVVGSLDLQLTQGRTGITFGETTLFRERPNVLKTGSSFVTAGSLGVTGIGVATTQPTLTVGGSLNLNVVNGVAGITFGSETTLFRESANNLRTGGNFEVSGATTILGNAVLTTNPTLTVTGSLSIIAVASNAGITFGGDTTLSRLRERELQVSSALVVGGSLSVLGSGLADGSASLTAAGSLNLNMVGGVAGITFGRDTTLFRDSANTLRTGGDFEVSGATTILGNAVLTTDPTLTVTGSLNIIAVASNAGITFGGDTTLSRLRERELQVSSALVVGGSLSVLGSGLADGSASLTAAGSLNLNIVGGVAGITFGRDTTLFRESANQLKTGGDFEVSGATTILGNAVLTTAPTLTVTGSLNIIAVASNAGITFGGDTTLSRLRERELQVSSALVVGGSLSVLGSGLADGSASLTAAGSLNLNIVGGVAGITFGRDTTLFRESANQLKTGGDFQVSGATTILGNAVLTTDPTLTVTGSLNIIAVASNAGITFGGDTTLSRLRERELQVSSALVVGGSLSVLGSDLADGSASLTAAGSLNLNIVGGVAGITFGRDTTLFRSSANVLRTGGDFEVSGAVTILGNGVSTTSPALTVTGSLNLNVVNGIAGITFGETTLFRDRANVLRTGSSFITAGSLGVSGIGVDPTLATLTVGGSLNLQLTNGESGITFGGDTTLFRSAANELKTGNDFVVGGSLTLSLVTGDLTSGITFGTDTYLFRSSGGQLTISGSLNVEQPTLTVGGSLNLDLTNGQSGITFGGETTLFRSSANVLKTGGNFEVSGATTILGNGVLTTDPTLTVTGSLNIISVASNAGITLGGDTTLSRSRARELQVSSALVVGGSLSVLGSGLADGSASLTVGGSLNLNIVGGIAGITFGGETTLFRSTANELQTGGAFVVGGSLVVNGAFELGDDLSIGGALTVGGTGVSTADPTLTVTGSLSIIAVASNAGITLGGDTTLSRLRERELQVSSALVVGGSLSILGSGLADGSASLTAAGSLNLNIVGGVAGITFGRDTTLFRDSANTLKTGGDFEVSGATTILGNAVVTSDPTLTVTGSLSILAVASNAGITFGGDTTLSRPRARELQVSSALVVGGSLSVLGSGLADGSASLTAAGSLNLNIVGGVAGITFGRDTTLFRESANQL